MKILGLAGFTLLCFSAFSQQKVIRVDGKSEGRIFEGIGAVSAGASTRLLFDYKENYRSDINDFMFKPKFGAAFQHLKVEIGGGENSTCGSEPSHAITRDEVNNPVNRGYEFWLMSEARKRNPSILLDCLPWAYPNWLSGIFSQDAADWYVSFLDVAKKYYNLDLDWVSAGQNEMGTNRDWIVNQLRPTMDRRGYKNVKLQAPDDDSEYWQIIPHLNQDSVYNSIISAVGYHYVNGREPWTIDQVSGKDATYEAKMSGKSLWASEEWANGKEWDGAGALLMARMINKFYIRDRIVKTQFWSPIDGIYKGLPWEETGMMSADQPWSGHYEVWPGIWAIAHTTQFTEPGWQYLDNACGQFSDTTWKGSYVTLKNPATKDWSMVVCTDAITPLKVVLENDLKSGPVYVWHSDANDQFICIDTIAVENGGFSYSLKGTSLYSFTTTTGQQKGSKVIPPAQKFPFPYKENFEAYKEKELPKYFSDQKGSFEVFNKPGYGLCLQQIIPKEGFLWHSNSSIIKPYTVFGDHTWTDYSVNVDVLIAGGDVEIGGRFVDQNQLTYGIILDESGNWNLRFLHDTLATGVIKGFDKLKWHKLRLDLVGDEISVYVDGKHLCTVNEKSLGVGMAFLASSYQPNCFDNISITSVKRKPKKSKK